jgi:hypothetical protein
MLGLRLVVVGALELLFARAAAASAGSANGTTSGCRTVPAGGGRLVTR